MRAFFSLKFFFTLFLLVLTCSAFTQSVQITLGPDEIGENQVWTITVTAQNERLKSYDNFPDLVGFRKRGQSTQSTTNIVNGQISSSQSVIMTYLPLKQGVITVPSFTMNVNDKPIAVAGKKVKVGPPVQQQRDPYRSPFDRDTDDFFGRGETEFVDIKEDAFLALSTSKDEVYVGEGFNTTLSLFIAEDNRAPLSWHDLGKQVSEIVKKLRPNSCWEENFNIENIEGESVQVNGKDYLQYKIYQATFFPLNAQPVDFPAVGLEMIKYKVAKNPSFFGQNRKEDFKTFYTKPKRVNVKELPPHPLRNAVAVGDYRLEEKMRSTDLETGQSTGYEFTIFGEGNISSITKPDVRNDAFFEFYEPNVRQEISRNKSRVTGTKAFSYFMIPREPGTFKLGDYFKWVYFNPKLQQYDTLKSQLTVFVTGESKKNDVIESTDPGSFYDKITTADNTLRAVTDTHWEKWIFNIFIIVILAASAFLLFKK
ncbi:MAG: BatD family protein [Cyclobacteriaceae bacterium]|nr:BatD family protein [Cyclobacteriaceae bacterium]